MTAQATNWQHFESEPPREEARTPSGARLAGFHMDHAGRRVVANGRVIQLTDTELRLLVAFLQRSGTVLSRDDALATVWGLGYRGCRRAVDVYVSRLRAKLREAVRLEAKRGVGYTLSPVTAESAP